MENSVSALQIAAGLIIATLLISLLVFVFNNISKLENTKRDTEVTKEVSEFNKKFAAFDKTSMYGTDVISVLGLAISNNKIQNQELTANPIGNYEDKLDYSINIEVKIKNDISQKTIKTAYIEKKNNSTGLIESQLIIARSDLPTNMSSNPEVESSILLTAGTYSLDIYEKDSSGNYRLDSQGNKIKRTNAENIYKKIEDIAITSEGRTTTNTVRSGRRTIITERDPYGIGDFKKCIYKCTDIKYNGSGRIYYMKFEPK